MYELFLNLYFSGDFDIMGYEGNLLTSAFMELSDAASLFVKSSNLKIFHENIGKRIMWGKTNFSFYIFRYPTYI